MEFNNRNKNNFKKSSSNTELLNPPLLNPPLSFLTRYSQLLPCGHSTITDTPL